jgi:hypothetical protein
MAQVRILNSPGGSVQVVAGTLQGALGRTVTLAAVPDPGFKLVGWDVQQTPIVVQPTGCCNADATQYPIRNTECLDGPIELGGFGAVAAEGDRIIYDIVTTCDNGSCEERFDIDPASVRVEFGQCLQELQQDSLQAFE